MLESREYQDEALAAIESEWAKGNTRTAVVLPTGMGKTIVFARLTKDRAQFGKVLILVHRDELARSAVQKLHSVAPELEIGTVKAEQNDVHAPVIVGSVQTLRNLKRRAQLTNVRTIIVDEAHHAVAQSYLTILEWFGAFGGCQECWTGAQSIAPDLTRPFPPGHDPENCTGPTPTAGFSATLARDDHRGLARVWQSVAYRKAIVWGIAKGYLADVKAKQIVLQDLDLDGVPINRGDYQEDELGRALLGAGAGPRIAEAWLEHAKDRRGFLFTPNVATAHQFADDLDAAGIKSHVITGKTPVELRQEAYRRFQDGECQALVNCMVLTEGFDMPQADVAVIARATKSRNLYIQMAGRVLRPWPGKESALLLDVVGATRDHKLASIVDLAEDKIKEIKPDETITDAIDREDREGSEIIEDLGGTLRARDVDLFHASSKAWLRTRKGVWFIPTRPGTWFLWPEPGNPGAFRVMHHSKDSKSFRVVEDNMTLDYAMAWAEELATEEDPSISNRAAFWRNKRAKATDAQKGVADRLRIPYTDETTKVEMSDLISVAMASRLLDGKVGR